MNKTLPRVKKFDTPSHAQGTKRPSEDDYRAVMEGRKALTGNGNGIILLWVHNQYNYS
jgi:hypothetical protein